MELTTKAFRKRQSYGTVLIDLDRSRPIALLNDPEAQTRFRVVKEPSWGQSCFTGSLKSVQEWHYARRTVSAIQVADRFHLLQNLAEVVEQVFRKQEKALKAAAAAHQQVFS